MVSKFRRNQPPPPDYGNIDSDDDSIPPPPPPPEGHHDSDVFEDHETDPLANGDNGKAAPVKKWRLLKKEAEHVLIPQDDPANDSDEYDEYDNGATAPHGRNNANGDVPMQGHFRGIQNAQDFDEEEAGMDEIEVPSSSVVARLNHHEERSQRRSKFTKYAIALVVCVCALVAITVGSVVGSRGGDGDVNEAQGRGGAEGGGNNDNERVSRQWTPTTPAGRYMQEFLPERTTNSMNDADSPASKALDWIENDPANAAYGFDKEDAFDDPVTRKNFEQRFAAASIAKSLNGGEDEPWRRNENWMSESDICDWQGIRCDDTAAENRRKLQDGEENDGTETATPRAITSIMLNGNNLRGTISPEIALLTDLETLALVGNWISGTIPPELYDLPNLQALDLYDNVLTGQISPNISKLTSMSGLYLGMNKLSGPIPEEIGAMENLQELWLDTNQLTGGVPAALANCEYLRDLRMNDNQLYGPIPKEYGTSGLTILKLGDNELTGGVPDTFADSNIVTLSLERNIALFADEFDEEGVAKIPDVIYAMPALEVLELANCGLNGGLPALDIDADFLNLRVFDISDNMFTGQIPRNYGNLADLRVLLMANNNFEGNLPPSFQNLENLVNLDLSKNILDGPIPEEWGDGLGSIQFLSLSANYLTGEIPIQLRRWQEIKVLKFDNNIFTGELPFGLDNFEGNLPPSFQNLENLVNLDLSKNILDGPIPEEWGDGLGSIQFLSLSANYLTGEIPIQLRRWQEIKVLKFDNNIFTGELPFWIGRKKTLGEYWSV
eukprot:CAMPEP_0204641888 /NCGR_PEP_ID=MMETSP0717-20131115/51386_1 /ASSEMBLY_ACC=CAM_ASM_000666 /TAXON_ID=230516 /ORGANISM="Chaetoceros curvisetus" /LENGTH=780 /DNA_ID=CAMNT_0051662613 /DNA_START=78 /DNA_END=2421 /DNA_ORIENTATION=-